MDLVGQEHHLCSKLQADTTHSPWRDKCILHAAHNKQNAAGCDEREQNLAPVKVTGGAKNIRGQGSFGYQNIGRQGSFGKFGVRLRKGAAKCMKVKGKGNTRRNKVEDDKRRLVVGTRERG